MTHTLMDLPFDENALEPHISKETLQYHHGKHHAGYINKLNDLIEGTVYADAKLEEIVKKADGGIFNNGAQVYNHNFYWNSMSEKVTSPSKELLAIIERDFTSMEAFKKKFLEMAAGLFGSGWVWLSINDSGTLVIESFSNAGNPLLLNHTPLLTCDVWEHAYYIDYRNARADYLQKWWELVNWDFVSDNLEACSQ
ncbi:superoxide dismutase [Fe] [Sulfurovum sp. TSL6]|uniref:superoxide dismutase n=1 Tax=Sulfurovum sp. TSL6 TaxID=2826995 RepID=UPI001CC4503B|nr:superoxide dismutase [Sulfurovum sp. TSL6]GIU00127.1 superoxide dismutase [Fe] [Sulfurovum sp. TSL6]